MSEAARPPPAETPPPATKRRVVVVAGAVVAALVIAAAAWFLTRPGDLQVSGNLLGDQGGVCIVGSPAVLTPVPVARNDPWNDQNLAGTRITFTDANNKVVATAIAGSSHWMPIGYNGAHPPCRVEAPYAVSLPRSDYYVVTVSRSAASALQPSEDWIRETFVVELSDVTDGKLDITVGSA